jgi:spoIIIJ-associated protein
VGDERKNTDGALLFDDEDGGGERDRDEGSRGKGGDGKAEESMEFVAGVLSRMGLHAKVTIRQDDDEQVVLDIGGADAGRAIGKKGMTLDALQFLSNKVVNRSPQGKRYIVVDSGDYRERHEANLEAIAKREAKRAIETGRVVTLEPMPARDRRLIHLSLSKTAGVSTKSNGEGAGRRIQIIPARGGGGGGGGGRRDRDRDRPRRDEGDRKPETNEG